MSLWDVLRGRKKAEAAEGLLSKAVLAALEFRRKLIADGASPADVNAGLERTLREHWPQERVWHYLCDTCSDTGLEMRECKPGQRCNGISTRTDSPKEQPGKYRRLCTVHATYTHDYGVPCHCSSGDRFRSKPRRVDDDLASIAKTKADQKWNRFGDR